MPIPLDSVDAFWKKLDLSHSISVEYGDLNCDHDMERFKESFNNQPDHGKSSFLRKLRGIMDPSKILIGEPSVKKNTRGRPKVKRVHHQTQVPHRYSCSGLNQELPRHSSFSMDLNEEPPRYSSSFMDLKEELPRHNSSFMDLNDEPLRYNPSFMDLNEEPPIYSSSFMDMNEEPTTQCSHQIDLNEILPEGHSSLLEQIPEIFHPYITNIQDVRGDGNCGFRSIAVCLGCGEDQWLYVRKELLDELMSSYGAYSTIFYGIDEIVTSLSFSGSPAPVQHWMTMPETGILIANRFGVIFHLLTIGGSMTCFPLWKGPEEFQYHRVFTISNINNNHYVMVQLEGEYPMPPISALWTRNKIPSAAGWQTLYMSRLEFYKNLKPPQKTFLNIAD